ncbi:thioredoxin family protein [Mesobacillus zeae]|uniref:Thioredoxin n=1 Tax=Mesobacillus zeae TaxID=1917180 RepID=A0A398BAB5_9BACI|nr:thioredoxin [Mesobacillus zeae]
MLKEFPLIKLGIVNAGEVTEIAGYLMAFTAPVLVLFADGKEVLREARFVPIEKLRNQLHRIYEATYGD